MKIGNKEVPTFQREWVRCPSCGSKFCIMDDRAQCNGVFVKCTRGCGNAFEIKIADGKQIK